MRILLVEDDRKLSFTLSFQLENEGFLVDTCEDGEEALYYIEQKGHDLVLLDRMLPSMDGITVLQTIRKKGIFTPVIILTALGELQDKLTGFDTGADDYLVKPFAFEELLARIKSILRRPGKWESCEELTFDDISFQVEEKILTGTAGSCTLSKTESRLLELFIRNQGQVLPRTLLLLKVWGYDTEVEDGNLDNYIHFLRRRIKSVGSKSLICTVRGIGYRLEKHV